MTNFKDKWSTTAKQSLMQRIGDGVKPKGALKPRVETATKRVHTQVLKLDTKVGNPMPKFTNMPSLSSFAARIAISSLDNPSGIMTTVFL